MAVLIQPMLNFVRAWILLSTLLVSAGWVLSAFNELNLSGYLVILLLAILALGFWWQREFRPLLPTARHPWRLLRHKLTRRFRRPAPMLFLLLAALALIGGALYPPTNIDTNAYRIPRVLHWLGQGQWHWIHTYDPPQNSSGCGFEWLAAPLILFTRTDWLLYLINWVSYLMLPGLIFSVFRRLEVPPRVAWWWMWFLSSGWCFAIQAGSTGNDSFAAIYALAAVDLALRARETQSRGDLWLSVLAVALALGAKQTNLPLLLPWLIAAGGSLKLLRARPLATAGIVLVCLLVSPLPVTIANLVHTGNWMGFSQNPSGLENPLWTNARFNGSPFWAIIGNVFNIIIPNLNPPYFPWAERWNLAVNHFIQTPIGAHFGSFDDFCHLWRFALETTVGMGPGICFLILASILGAQWSRRAGAGSVSGQHGFFFWLRLAPWASLLVFMAKTGEFSSMRLLAAYYPLLFPLLLVRPGHSYLVRWKWWQWLGCLLMLLTALLLVVSLDRPLFPARTLVAHLEKTHSRWKIVSSLARLYGIDSLSYRGERNPLAEDLPQDGQLIGYTSDGGILEPGLWFPLGSRKVEQVRAEDSPRQLRQLGIHYIVVEDLFLQLTHQTIEQWMDRYNAELIAQATFKSQPTYHSSQIYLVRLRSE